MNALGYRCKTCGKIRSDSTGEPPCGCPGGEERTPVVESFVNLETGLKTILWPGKVRLAS